MFSIPMALLLLELNGPDFLRVGLFPGIIKDWEEIKNKTELDSDYYSLHFFFYFYASTKVT